MSSGERPIGAAKGKQSDAEALCQPPTQPPCESNTQVPKFDGINTTCCSDKGVGQHWPWATRKLPRKREVAQVPCEGGKGGGVDITGFHVGPPCFMYIWQV